MRVGIAIASALALRGFGPNVIAQDEKEKKVILEISPEGPHGSVVGCLRPALKAAGKDWSVPFINGYLGIAFAFSMNPDGGNVWQAGHYE
jgi:hypothetical protein